MTTTYTITGPKGRDLVIRADFAESASPIMLRDGQGVWGATPFQVGAGKKPADAAKRVNRWVADQLGEESACWSPGQTAGLKIKASK